MSSKLTTDERGRIEAAIVELRAIQARGGAALSESWTRIQRSGLMLRDSLDSRPPSHGEGMLIAAAERCERFNPLRPRLEELASDPKTRQEILNWKARCAEARAKADAAQAALTAKRSEEVAKLSLAGGFALIDAPTAESSGLREVERQALLARVAAGDVEKAFGNWRLRAWCDGKLRSTKGD